MPGIIGTAPNQVPTVGDLGPLTFRDENPAGDIVGTTAAQVLTNKTITSPVIDSGAAYGVAYLNGSKVLTAGSGLTFDGSRLLAGNVAGLGQPQRVQAEGSYLAYGDGAGFRTINGTFTGGGGITANAAAFGGITLTGDGGNVEFVAGGSERMRIDASGNVGVGTSSPTQRLQVGAISAGTRNLLRVAGNYNFDGAYLGSSSANGGGTLELVSHTSVNTSASWKLTHHIDTTGGALVFSRAAAASSFDTLGYEERIRLDASGNLGLGVVPSAWLSQFKAIDVGSGAAYAGTATTARVFGNTYCDTGFTYRYKVAGSASYYYCGDGIHQWSTSPFGTAGSPISFTQAMTLSEGGNLLVGSTLDDRGHRIKVKGPSSGGVAASAADYCLAVYGADESAYLGFNLNTISTVSANPLIFGTNNTERARIDVAGNLLVGKTTSGYTLDGVEVAGAGVVTITRSSGTCIDLNRKSDGGVIAFYRSGSAIGSIGITTTATSYNTSSDYRLKNITGPVTNSGAYIDSLNPVEGSWKADGSTFVGLIAHEVQEASRTQVATGVKDGEEMQAMDYSASELIANMIAELKSLRARVAALENN